MDISKKDYEMTLASSEDKVNDWRLLLEQDEEREMKGKKKNKKSNRKK